MAKSALISVFDKQGIEPIVKKLNEFNIKIYSTGGTEEYIRKLGIPVTKVEDLTAYPSILGGRVKTLHPKVFGGILGRRAVETDKREMDKYEIPKIDMVVVDLYPFEKTVESGAGAEEIIEKIDIGGISLIRAAAKNFKDVVCVASREEYPRFLELLKTNKGDFSLTDKKSFATRAFHISSTYDTAIHRYFSKDEDEHYSLSFSEGKALRYGENPHQKAKFYGKLEEVFDQLSGKELSYNNLLDVDSAVELMGEFKGEPPTFAILKHTNACGLAQRENILEAYQAALEADPLSAFGGILIANTEIDGAAAQEIHKLFCEVVIAPSFAEEALEILKARKNRILLKQKITHFPDKQLRTCLNGILVQDKNTETDTKAELKTVTHTEPSKLEIEDLLFASKIGKHSKSNTIVLTKGKQLIASGVGETSRVDALKHAIEKARHFNFDLKGAVMASDAFFPFPDCVEIAHEAGIKAVIQPGGSKNDQLSIDYCNQQEMAMVFTGRRHFKH